MTFPELSSLLGQGHVALMLVDVQQDFLQRPGLLPTPAQLLPQLERLVSAFRQAGLPLVHCQTRVAADGSDAMPHWQGLACCRAGSAGVLAPEALAPLPGEAVFHKRFFSPFENPSLEAWLAAQQIKTLVVAGLYTHACVRSAVLDAYARGLRVMVAQDGVASPDVLHAEISREFLSQRAASFVPVHQILADLGQTNKTWAESTDELDQAVARALGLAQEWAAQPHGQRRQWLGQWQAALRGRRQQFIDAMVQELGKPLRDAQEEWQRAMAHLDAACKLSDEEILAPGVSVRYRPLGCVAIITPWNNPLALALGKIAPALALGNTVIWKPAPRVPRVSGLLMASLAETDLPPGLVNLLSGGAETGRRLMVHPQVAAVSITGSAASGRVAAALCALHCKPLQAELGGNNAHVVLAGADLAQTARDLVQAAFSFAGQRCTATRRIIVEAVVREAFLAHFVAAVQDLPLGDPAQGQTLMGPLESDGKLQATQRLVDQALADGARLLVGGRAATHLGPGAWYLPTVLDCADPAMAVVTEESFAPLVVILSARDGAHALALVNAVSQGLLAGLSGGDSSTQAQFMAQAQAGILRLGAAPGLHPAAPFGGWKSSGVGMPEHGRWDRDFYSRPQAVYEQKARQ